MLPSRYVYTEVDGRPDAHESAFAATALGHLMDRDPALRPALLHGNHDVEARREVIGRLEAIKPGMYATMRDHFQHEKLFGYGLDYVRDVLGIQQYQS